MEPRYKTLCEITADIVITETAEQDAFRIYGKIKNQYKKNGNDFRTSHNAGMVQVNIMLDKYWKLKMGD